MLSRRKQMVEEMKRIERDIRFGRIAGTVGKRKIHEMKQEIDQNDYYYFKRQKQWKTHSSSPSSAPTS